MGGQACVLYGGAEFSRDTDLAILIDDANLQRLQAALDDLQAECVAVPPFERKYLERGHAVHFRCQHPEARGMRIDVMARMRGVDDFQELWDRRTTVTLDEGGLEIDVLGLDDLVQAKKTQWDKDWPMIRRLVEASYFGDRDSPSPEQVRFWLAELRTPGLLVEVVQRFRLEAEAAQGDRPVIAAALQGASPHEVQRSMEEEEQGERSADVAFWEPLKRELSQLRRRNPGAP